MLRNRSIPAATVMPVLVYEDVAEAVEWLCDTFGFVERLRIGTHRVQLTLGDGAVIVTERRITQAPDPSDAVLLRPPHRGEVSHMLLVRVEDVDAHYRRAQRSGARIVQPPTDHEYGERQYTVDDLDGHRWTFTQSVADVAPEAWGGELLQDD